MKDELDKLRALIPERPRDDWNAFDDAQYYIAIAQAGPDLIAQAERANALEAATIERAVMVCPQCEGEGFYADGLDEAACSTECARCGSNGWIVDISAIRALKQTGADHG